MKFGAVPIGEAAGAILAHSLMLEGRRLRKGTLLDAADVAALRAAGVDSVTVARLEPGDVGEDDAALLLAEALIGSGMRAGAATTGRVNLHAERPGLFDADAARIDTVNRVDPALTVATLPPHARVDAGEMLATIKIIPFAVPRSALDRACKAAGTGALVLHRFKALRAALIQTTLPGLKAGVIERTVEVTRARLDRLGSQLMLERRVDHDTGALAAMLAEIMAAGGVSLVLICGASAVADTEDVIPAAIRRAGGRVVHLGMPVDPGNLLLLGAFGDIPVIGLPGCARSLKRNGFDWVLERLAAGQPVGSAEIAGMGVGGLLSEIPSRPEPRDRARKAVRRPITGIVLAAGLGRRMGANKMLAELDGRPMICHAIEALRGGGIDDVLVVLGRDGELVRAACAGHGVRFVVNHDFEDGIARSVAAGIAAVSADADGALIALGDMPRVAPGTIRALIGDFAPEAGRAICVPVHHGRRGNPVLWSRRFFAEMRALTGDVGARRLMAAHDPDVFETVVEDPGVLIDVDTPDALAALAERKW